MRTKSPTFIHELPLQADDHAQRQLAIRLEMARMLYNACLQHILKQLGAMRSSAEYAQARQLPQGSKAKREAFRQLNLRFGFNEYALHAFAASLKKRCAIGDHLDINTIQKIATRAFQAAQQYSFGRRGRPRFKRKGWLSSVEGKSNKSGIRWCSDHVQWSGLTLRPIFDRQDKFGVQAHAMMGTVKYVRLVRRSIRDKVRWFAQLVIDGTPKVRHAVGADRVAFDIGPSTIAAVSAHGALIEPLSPEVDVPVKRIKALQRAMDRSRRATNPDCFNPDGTYKKGAKIQVRSIAYKALSAEKAEAERILARTRRHSLGALSNRILALGAEVRAEKLSYKAFQRRFGKSVGRRAPGQLVELIRRKAVNAGGGLHEFPTRTTRLSQLCHGCGTYTKKPLSDRWHDCACGVTAQRDLYSAFLALCVEEGKVDISRAEQAWPGAHMLLERAMSTLSHQAAMGWQLPVSVGRRWSCSPAKAQAVPAEVAFP